MDTAEEALHELKQRLSDLRGQKSLADFARAVHVAPQTLKDILNAKLNAYGNVGAKMALGRAETLSRIIRYANQGTDRPINLPAVLNALGLDALKLEPQLGFDPRATASLQDEDVLFRTHGDVVIRRIEQRKRSPDPRPIKTGIDQWAPFCPPGEDMATSFAGVFMRRLLGCLSPLRWGNPELRPLGFAEASDANCVRTGKYDAIFSAYDVPARRLDGFAFIHLPGLRGALGALAFGPKRPVNWESILDRDEISDRDLTVFVVNGEVGDVFLSGSCDYNEAQIRRLEKSIDASTIAKELWSHIETRLERRKVVPSLLFCADNSITAAVELELTAAIKANFDQVEATALIRELKQIEADEDYSPLYPLGIGVNGQAYRWIEILKDALENELFANGGPLTAKHYVKMLARSDAEWIKVVPLESDLPAHLAIKFAKHIRTAVEKLDPGIKQTTAQRLEVWLAGLKQGDQGASSGHGKGK